MSTPARHRMVVKIGSQLLCQADGGLDSDTLSGLVGQVAELRRSGWEVILVSSGAVAAGTGVLPNADQPWPNPVVRKQVLAAAGQVRLMETYTREFRGHGLDVAQVLASKADFQTRQHYLNMRACLEGVLSAGLVPIANENDVVSTTELMFTDNDELAGLLASMLSASHLCLLTSVDGVLGPDGQLIPEWNDERFNADELTRSGTSTLGRGGMHSKISVARKTARLGIETCIANGREGGLLARIASRQPAGTRFPADSKASPTKRWLASMDDHALGAVYINAGAEQTLLDPEKQASLLPVGVDRVEGDFQRGDVVQVRNATGDLLGCGRSQYDHEEARSALGQREQKPLIHYDYLYLVE